MADLIRGLDPARVAENAARVREELAQAARKAGRARPATLLAAVKYVAVEELGVLAQAGIDVVGENRAQELEAKAAAWPDAGFEWHFIGRLQSRKVKQLLPHVALIQSVASDSALTQLEKHGTPDTRVLIEVNVAGEEGKEGIAPDELPAYIERATVTVAGLMTMPPLGGEENRRHFAALRELAERHGLSELSMGTSQDYVVAAEEGATIVRLGTTLYS